MKIFIPAIVIFLCSCTFKEADQFISPLPIDSVSFSVDIVPVLETYCFGPGFPDPDNGPTCHYPPGSYGNIPAFFNDCSNLQLYAKNGQLKEDVLSPNPRMPPPIAPPLPAEDTALIGAWIREGYPCN